MADEFENANRLFAPMGVGFDIEREELARMRRALRRMRANGDR